MIKPGDYIGGIYTSTKDDGTKYYILVKSKVSKIVSSRKATKVYSNNFYPLDLEDIETNTKDMEEASGYILTKEAFKLTEPIERHCLMWIDWANKNPDKVDALI